MKRPVLLFVVIAVLFGAGGVYFGIRHHTPVAPESPAVATFFVQQLPDAKGKQHAMSQWQGKPLIVNFWATWCPPCVAEMPELSVLQTELAPKGIQIIGIGVDSPSAISEFAGKYKIGYPLFVAGLTGTELSRQFGNVNGGLPFTVLIGKKGEVVKTYIGRLKMDQLRADLAAL
jgi:thiol-disulfide isomerase/thioredoxin